MKNVILVSLTIGVVVCGVAGLMCVTGFGTPNCEPTIMGYAEFWATLFCCGVAASILGYVCLAIGCILHTVFYERV